MLKSWSKVSEDEKRGGGGGKYLGVLMRRFVNIKGGEKVHFVFLPLSLSLLLLFLPFLLVLTPFTALL